MKAIHLWKRVFSRLHFLGFRLRRAARWLRWGKLNAHVISTVANNAAEIEYSDRFGRVVGFWGYGSWHPAYPHQGEIAYKPPFRTLS